MLPAAEVSIATAQVTQEFKASMLAIPETIAAEVAGLTVEGQVYATLAAVIRAALTEFADGIERPGTAEL